MAFLIERQDVDNRNGWTSFHKEISDRNPAVSALGYMPLILSPAHEYDTLLTVMERSLCVANRLGEKYVILTVGQALYCKLCELRWSNTKYMERVVLRLGGLHISMNFLKAIGQHMQSSGLSELWLESNVFGEGAITRIFSGKSYSKGMRAHKLTFQALWRILLPQFRAFLKTEQADTEKELFGEPMQRQELFAMLSKKEVLKLLQTFFSVQSEDSPNFSFWWDYLKMVSTILLFTQSIREGIWELYLHAIRQMVPFFARYDHLNYAKSTAVYLADMSQLPEDVRIKFLSGDFVVKRSEGQFNQVDADQAQEWIVGVGKDAGGVVGITNVVSALQRWALSFHWRSDITSKTHAMFGLSLSATQHNEMNEGRRSKDRADEESLLATTGRFGIFREDFKGQPMRNIATKDLTTLKIQESLLNAREKGPTNLLNSSQPVYS